MDNKYDLIVIGGGPAGITLSKKLGKKLKMAVIRPEDYSMVYCVMPYVIENLIDKQKCFKKDGLVTEAGSELIRDEVISIDFNNKVLKLKSDKLVKYDKLVIATGATPFIPNIEGVKLKGSMGFKTQQDLEKINRFIENGLEKAVIVGAGAIGIELAQALNHKGLDVTLVDMSSQVLPNLVGSEFAHKASEQLTKNNIKLLLNSKVVKLTGKNYVEEVHLDNGEKIILNEYPTSIEENNTKTKGLILFSTGVVPDLKFIPENTIDIGKQGIIVNEKMETNLPDVFAVGDCVQYKSFITGNIISGKLATNAVPMARVLAKNIIGEEAKYQGYINGAATKLYNYYVGGTGLTAKAAKMAGFEIVEANSQLSTQFPIMPDSKELHLKLIADKKTKKIIGGQVYSGEPVATLIDLISFAIQKGATAEDLLDLSYSSQPYQSFFPAGNIIVMTADQLMNQITE